MYKHDHNCNARDVASVGAMEDEGPAGKNCSSTFSIEAIFCTMIWPVSLASPLLPHKREDWLRPCIVKNVFKFKSEIFSNISLFKLYY